MLYQLFLKRIFDLSLVLILLLPFVIIIIIACIINFYFVGFRVVFIQKRVGKNGRLFNIYKLRTMAGSSNVSKFASSEATRITPYGNILRKLRIDELPQILNILMGDMSFIGPRPEQPEFVDQYIKTIDNYNHRHIVRPGITGLAQIEHGYTDSQEGTRIKVEYDLLYIKKIGFKNDLEIIYKTFFEIMRMSG